ncbi:hypothetical protein KOR42_05870 [Thalassoglobus neptunius]|uniref:Uncharacterized protein n=1 Tax=Thalassoglobus neptunius TaxID=1938619 RepID=A0A5C5X3S3_9PLAN|nr:hypothetical protein [Thalassoglobus neptunius]TWT57229.1 hypothetical protein KOR42_05870 [Thalassoglobus neptunius]
MSYVAIFLLVSGLTVVAYPYVSAWMSGLRTQTTTKGRVTVVPGTIKFPAMTLTRGEACEFRDELDDILKRGE